MKKLLLGFNQYNRINESLNSSKSKTGCIIAASNSSEKKGQERFITEVSMMDPKKLNELLNSVISQGSSIISALDKSWKTRQELGLDEGELRKKGDWYIGKGAWRVNSAKADQLGLTPSFIKYYDPLQAELLEKYFSEDYGKSGASVSPTGELSGLEMEDEPEIEKVPSEEELELVSNESLKYIRKMYESDDEFTLGPPTGAKNAVVVDTKELVDQLVDNFFLESRDNIMIWGAPGIGKTEVVKQAAKTIGKRIGKEVPVTVVTLATKAAYDIAGIPILFAKESSGETVLQSDLRGKIGMDFAYPAWLPGPSDADEGILFFDEINRAEVDVMGAALTLLLDRTSGSYKIPDGWRVWAAGNRDMDGPVKPFEGAMASRFLGGHFHLVPTVEAWSEWARSDKGFFKGTSEYYIPAEFISFVKLKDVVEAKKGGGSAGTISNLGRTYRVKFNYFYDWDQASASESGGGKMEGFPTPRTWAKAFANIYQKIKSTPELMSQASSTVDPKFKIISLFGTALLDYKIEKDILIKMSAIVGTDASDAFLQFAKQLARLNDENGTLVEKIENIFTNPKAPRPLLDIPKLGADEIFGVLNAIEGSLDELVDSGKFTTPELINWMKYILELEDDKKATQGEITQHVTMVLTKHALVVRPLSTPKNPEIKGSMVDIIKEFANRWKILGEQIRSL